MKEKRKSILSLKIMNPGKERKIIAIAMISIMLLTVFGASSSIAQRKIMAPQEIITVSVVNFTGAPIENSKVFMGGGHQDPLTIVLDTQITDENGLCEFNFPAGMYTVYVLGPDKNGSAVSGLGAFRISAYFPNLKFISVVEGENLHLNVTLIKRPLFWSVGATPFNHEI